MLLGSVVVVVVVVVVAVVIVVGALAVVVVPPSPPEQAEAKSTSLETLRLVTWRSRRVIYRMALERFGLSRYFVGTCSDGGSERRVRG